MIFYARVQDYEILKANTINNETKQEYHAILENSDQLVMSHDDDHNI